MHRIRIFIGKCGWVCLVLFLAAAPMASAQTTSTPNPVALDRATPPVVTSSDSGPRVTIGPGLARCRTLLGELAQLAKFEVRNLAHVPDTEVYVDFSAASLLSVVDKILGYAKVDFILVGRSRSDLLIAAVFDRRSAGASEAPVHSALANAGTSAQGLQRDSDNLPIPPQVDLPLIGSSSGAAGMPSGRPLDVRPEVIQISAPAWQPVEMTPMPVEVPSGMTPQVFPIAAPPPTSARPKVPPGGR